MDTIGIHHKLFVPRGAAPEAPRAAGWSTHRFMAIALTLVALTPSTVLAQEPVDAGTAIDAIGDIVAPERVSSTAATFVLITALSLAPALLLMTTCFVRISVVLAILRQALGIQGVPSNQVLAALGLFMTAAVMMPVWQEIHAEAFVPYRAEEITFDEAIRRATPPMERFMAAQIERTGNSDDVWLFLRHSGADAAQISAYDQVPLRVLAPAFLLSELKTAFLIGFQIFLPFLVIDLVVASVITAMGLLTVPPSVVALPAKLLLFVMVDGWHLVVGSLIASFN